MEGEQLSTHTIDITLTLDGELYTVSLKEREYRDVLVEVAIQELMNQLWTTKN